MTKPVAVWEDWTPEKAQEVLDFFNKGNRSTSTFYTTSYAKAMREGAWSDTGDTIKIDTEGRLVDGQHRLHALVEAGVTLPFLTVRGVDPAIFTELDQGFRRTASQFMGDHGGTKSSTVKRLRAFDGKSTVGGGYKIDSTKDINALLDSWNEGNRDELFEAFYPKLKSLQSRTGIPIAPMMAVLIKSVENGRTVNDEKITEFIDTLYTGIGFYENDPRQFLREKFMREGASLTKEWNRSQHIVAQAWDKFVRSVPMKQARMTNAGFKRKVL